MIEFKKYEPKYFYELCLLSDDEWKEYYILAEYVYNSRINQIDAILNGYVDGTEKTRLAHARNVLQDGLEEIKRQQAKYEVK